MAEVNILISFDAPTDPDSIIAAARELGFEPNTDDPIITQMNREGGLILGTLEEEFIPSLWVIPGVVNAEIENPDEAWEDAA